MGPERVFYTTTVNGTEIVYFCGVHNPMGLWPISVISRSKEVYVIIMLVNFIPE
jgi:hypothetical protein